jgi:hypothetical protein
MSGAGQAFRGAGQRLASTPAAVFLAVLTLGLGAASTARHLGLYRRSFAGARRCTVVLACPRTNAAHATAAGVHTSPAKAAQSSPAAAAKSYADSPAAAAATTGPEGSGQGVSPEKNAGRKAGGGGLTVPLPDFSAPELSRFISPL